MALKKVLRFIKNETVLTISAVLAAASCFLVPPDREYLGYINAETLVVLFCLMAVMAGLRELGVFGRIARGLLRSLGGERALIAVLLALCFFGSMVITNDVALITFVPLAIMLLDMEHRDDLLCLTVALMTVAANLGSILTPIGNPQNLYIYSVSGLSLGEFTLAMLPYAALSAAMLAVSVPLLYKNSPVDFELEDDDRQISRLDLAFFLALFALCVLSVAKLVSIWVLLPVVTVCVAARSWRLLLKIDYSLLLTFVCFFIFIGNMGRFEPFRRVILSILEGRELPVAAALSQVLSNVPTALLLGGFTNEWRGLLAGVNIGGLGTLIASMASLISYKQLAHRAPERKGRYLAVFTAVNLVFLAALIGLAAILGDIR